MRYRENKLHYKNYDAVQQCFLIALLNRHFNVTLLYPTKLSVLTLNTFRIDKVSDGVSTVNVCEFSKEQCKEMFTQDKESGTKVATATKLYEKNRRVFTINYLSDLALEDGYFFDITPSKKHKFSIWMDRIERVWYNGQFAFSKEDIVRIGTAVNEYIFHSFKDSNTYTLEMNNKYVNSLLPNY